MRYWNYIPDYIQAISVAVAAVFAAWSVNSWRRETIGKRKTEVAEQAIVAASRVQSALSYVRSPLGHSGEGKTRQKEEGENEKYSDDRDQAFVPIERLNKFKDDFSQLGSARILCGAYFGKGSMRPFDDLFKVRSEIIRSAQMMMLQVRRHKGGVGQFDQKLEDVIWWHGEDDEISKRINKAVLEIENLCAKHLKL